MHTFKTSKGKYDGFEFILLVVLLIDIWNYYMSVVLPYTYYNVYCWTIHNIIPIFLWFYFILVTSDLKLKNHIQLPGSWFYFSHTYVTVVSAVCVECFGQISRSSWTYSGLGILCLSQVIFKLGIVLKSFWFAPSCIEWITSSFYFTPSN